MSVLILNVIQHPIEKIQDKMIFIKNWVFTTKMWRGPGSEPSVSRLARERQKTILTDALEQHLWQTILRGINFHQILLPGIDYAGSLVKCMNDQFGNGFKFFTEHTN